MTRRYFISKDDAEDYNSAYWILLDIYRDLDDIFESIVPESLLQEIDRDIENMFWGTDVSLLIQKLKSVFQKITFCYFEGFFTYDSHLFYPLACVPYRSFNPKMIGRYTMMIVDSGINVLTKTEDKEYPYLEKFIESAKKYGSPNCLWTIPDYPFKVIEANLKSIREKNHWEQKFLRRTERNIKEYHEIPYTIVSIQYKFGDINSFRRNWERFYGFSQNLGVGNLLKCRNSSFFKKILQHIYFNNSNNKRVHFFGTGIPLIKDLLSFIQQYNPSFFITFDTVKWSITSDKELLKVNNGRFCRSENRDLFLTSFIDKMALIRKDLRVKAKVNKRILNIMDFV
ncbi:hypothetical protein LCGC14_1122340 [marine sediment metagenome]|uniref:Uncharacterized protein n=1 Tax=marine sediment metagenome TaxID=412755 RepID=A0A0F9M8D1_9ZZZZ